MAYLEGTALERKLFRREKVLAAIKDRSDASKVYFSIDLYKLLKDSSADRRRGFGTDTYVVVPYSHTLELGNLKEVGEDLDWHP